MGIKTIYLTKEELEQQMRNNAKRKRNNATLKMPLTNTLYYNNKSSCGNGRMQLRGTCWFHSILNIFLLSSTGRMLLRKALKMYLEKQPVLLNIRNNSNACPMRGHINLQYFWSYVKYKLSSNTSGKATRNNIVSENHLIRNLNLRNKNQTTEGGSYDDLLKFIKAVFPPSMLKFILSPFIPSNKFNKNIPVETDKYTLFGCYIGANWKKLGKYEGHAICGYMCNNIPYIYDSNMKRSIQLDWINDPSSIKEYFRRRYIYENQNQNISDIEIFFRIPLYIDKSYYNI